MPTKEDPVSLRKPYPLRMTEATRKKAEEEAARLDRSLHWVLNKALERGLDTKKAA